MSITLKERVYLDADGRATTDEATAAYLWGTPGMVVKDSEAESVGYRPGAAAVEVADEPAPKAYRGRRRTKVVEGPGGDK